MVKFFLWGKDNRIELLEKLYEKEGKVTNNIAFADYIITPIPFSKDGINITGTDISVEEFAKKCINKKIISGAISNKNRRILEINNVMYLDLMELDEMAILNAIPTAEGAIAEAIDNTDITIFNSNVLVLGYGRVGKILTKTLYGMGAKVYCMARKEKDLAQIFAMGYNEIDLKKLNNYLENMQIIFNTVPQKILDKKRIGLVNKDTVIIDISSNPGGVDFEEAKKLGIKASLVLSIPAKVAKNTAAMYMKQIIDKKVLEGEF